MKKKAHRGVMLGKKIIIKTSLGFAGHIEK